MRVKFKERVTVHKYMNVLEFKYVRLLSRDSINTNIFALDARTVMMFLNLMAIV